MKKKMIFMGFALMLMFVSFSGCKSKNPSAITPIQPPQQVQAATVQEPPAEGDNDFTFDFYRQINSNINNVFFSPFSMFDALAMCYEGAKGQTSYQMAQVLYLQQDNAARWQSFQSLISEINNPAKNYTLSTANNLWLEQNYPFLPSFLNTVETYYSASATAMDFVNNPASCLQTINNAVSNETNGKITNLLPPGSVNTDTALVLTNAIYFYAKWASQFNAANTVTQNFTTSSGTVEQVSTMHETIAANVENYYGVAQALELPYVNKEVSMFIFLPPSGGMAGLDSYMTGANMNAWLAARPITPTVSENVAVSLPKFTIKTSYNMVPDLEALGMVLPFSQGADFTGISTFGNLYITAVFHNGYVSVAEQGTEAAAATGVAIGTAYVMQTTPFTINRPFILMIRENTSNTILFFGKVNDPNAG
jgi:serpin B